MVLETFDMDESLDANSNSNISMSQDDQSDLSSQDEQGSEPDDRDGADGEQNIFDPNESFVFGTTTPLAKAKAELRWVARQCSDRGLLYAANWAAELALSDSLSTGEPTDATDASEASDVSEAALAALQQDLQWDAVVAQELADELWNEPLELLESHLVLAAKTQFDLKEYDRCAHMLRRARGHRGRFLRWYSAYLAAEKRREEEEEENTNIFGDVSITTAGSASASSGSSVPIGSNASAPAQSWGALGTVVNGTSVHVRNKALKDLHKEMTAQYEQENLDGFEKYLYGLVLKGLDLHGLAVVAFAESAVRCPMNWSAWLEIVSLCNEAVDLPSFPLGDHWMRGFFEAHAYIELQKHAPGLEILSELRKSFPNSSYILGELSLSYHNQRDYDAALGCFGVLRKRDPFRLEKLDLLSDIMYVKDMRDELSLLASHCHKIDKYRSETCYVIGNFYSLRSEHEKSVMYFRRAIRLNPCYASAWTLMGHEYLELGNTAAAVHAYRKAIEISPTEYRAWYCLAQRYELMKAYEYALVYYSKAAKLRPFDSRMVVAQALMYENLGLILDAIYAYTRAEAVGDTEGLAVVRLFSLYSRLNMSELAAHYAKATFERFESDTNVTSSIANDAMKALLYLAKHSLKLGNHGEAEVYINKLLATTGSSEMHEEAMSLLKVLRKPRK